MKYKILKAVDNIRFFFSNKLITPARFIFLAYFIITFIGFLLLSQPISIVPGKVLQPIDILFVAVSSITVTGLSPIDIASSFTMFGQLIMLILMQIGGLGYMALATLTALMIGKKIGLKERLVLQAELNQLNIGGIVKFLKTVALIYFGTEFIGFILLMFSFVPKYGVSGIWFSFFLAISAFNSAGFSPFSDNLMSFKTDSIVNLSIILMIVIGGLGAVVLYEIRGYLAFIIKRIKSRQNKIDLNIFLTKPKFSLHTKIVLWTTLFFYIVCFILVIILEPGIREHNWWQQFLESTFVVVNARSGGFNTIDLLSMSSFTMMMMIFLMFTGVGTASTGGGIRVTTLVVMIATCLSVIKGYAKVEIWKRVIDNTIVLRAFSIFFLSLLWISIAVLVLLETNKVELFPAIFEVVSAFGTVGLSLGITATLDDPGKWILCATMLFGRIGVLTFFIALLQPLEKRPNINYPNERVVVGG